MKTKKFLTTLCLALSIIVSSSIPAFASTENTPSNTDNINNYDTSVYGSTSLDDTTSIVSENLTFDEIVAEIANDHNISINQAMTQVVNSFMDSNNMNSRSSRATALLDARASTYHTISSTVDVTSSYKPSVKFYCLTDTWPGSSFRAIEKILDVSMNRSYNGISKQFGGTVYANLETANSIYWRVEGDFYNNGTTTYDGSVSIGLGEGSSISFGVSYATNHYAYAYKTGYARF